MVPTAWIYSIQFRLWPPQLHQHLHPHSTYHLGSRTYPLPPDLHCDALHAAHHNINSLKCYDDIFSTQWPTVAINLSLQLSVKIYTSNTTKVVSGWYHQLLWTAVGLCNLRISSFTRSCVTYLCWTKLTLAKVQPGLLATDMIQAQHTVTYMPCLHSALTNPLCTNKWSYHMVSTWCLW